MFQKTEFLSATKADTIFLKPIDQGVIYVLKYKKVNEKQHITVNNIIEAYDNVLKGKNGSKATSFRSINDNDLHSSQVISFERDTPRKDNHLYRTIFDSRNQVLPGVIVWDKFENEDDSHEFDVVKKRKAMDAEPPTPSTEDSPVALAAFEDFEHSVLSALKLVQEDELINFRMEMLQLEYDMSQGKITTSGGTYFAWSSCLNCMKIGATRRDDPHIRLRELSRHVTVPFTLVGWIPTPAPFRLESATHAHFAAKRIRNAGAGTEFFNIDAAIVEEYVKRFE